MLNESKKDKATMSLFSFVGELLSVPVSFFGGLVVGLIAPVAALAGIVGGVYLFTKKVPFASQVVEDEASGERSLTLTLMPPDEAQAAFQARLAELKDAWARIREDLAEVTCQTDDKPRSSEEPAAEPKP